MQNFVETSKNFGEIKEGDSVSIEYLKTPDTSNIIEMSPGCASCTSVFNYHDKVVIVFKADTIPDHLIQDGRNFMLVDRYATITFADRTTESLYFQGKIVR